LFKLGTNKVAHHSFPGGYPFYYHIRSNLNIEVACPSCVNQNRVGKDVEVKQEINYEYEIFCDVCDKQIESAYGEKNE